MAPEQALWTCLRKTFVYSGRARRPEFWWFFAFSLFLDRILALLGVRLGGVIPLQDVAALALLLPILSVSVRRLHDVDLPGWWIALHAGLVVALTLVTQVWLAQGAPETLLSTIGGYALIAAVAVVSLWLLWNFLRPSMDGPNRYGDAPRPQRARPAFAPRPDP